MGGEVAFSLDGLAEAIVIGAAVVILAVVGVRFAGRLGLPGLLLYLGWRNVNNKKKPKENAHGGYCRDFSRPRD